MLNFHHIASFKGLFGDTAIYCSRKIAAIEIDDIPRRSYNTNVSFDGLVMYVRDGVVCLRFDMMVGDVFAMGMPVEVCGNNGMVNYYYADEHGIVSIGDECAIMVRHKRASFANAESAECIRQAAVETLSDPDFVPPISIIGLVVELWEDLPIEVARNVLLEFIDDTAPKDVFNPDVISYAGSIIKTLEGYYGDHYDLREFGVLGGKLLVGVYVGGLYSMLKPRGDFVIYSPGLSIGPEMDAWYCSFGGKKFRIARSEFVDGITVLIYYDDGTKYCALKGEVDCEFTPAGVAGWCLDRISRSGGIIALTRPDGFLGR
jgi:hypothetical protein